MASSALVCAVACLTAGIAVVIYIIAADKQRFLASFDLKLWRESYYLRALPNFLQSLHDNHFPSAWPSQRNAVASLYFRMRTRPLLKRHPVKLRRAFIQQHITLFALLEILRPFVQDFILSEQQRIAGHRLLEMEDTIERDRLMEFLEAARHHRDQFFKTLTQFDRQVLASIIDRRFLPTLRAAHAIYQEHGYSLVPEFTQLRRWDEMTGSELVHDLPTLPAVPAAKRRAKQPAQDPIIGPGPLP